MIEIAIDVSLVVFGILAIYGIFILYTAWKVFKQEKGKWKSLR